MKSFRSVRLLWALPLFALASCGDGGAGAGTPAAPVAAVPAPAGQSWTETSNKTAEGYVLGNPNAPIKLVEYGSRLCPACKALADEGYRPLIDTYVSSGKVSFEFREFLVHGTADLPPALLGRCGGAAPFFPLLEAMYVGQPAFNQRLATATQADSVAVLADKMQVVEFVKQRGLPEAKARACLADTAEIDRLTKQTQDKGSDGTVAATPTLLVNGRKIDGTGWSDVEKALKGAGA